MELLVGGLSSIISIVTFCIFGAGVMKLFQMATTLTEIKDLLTTMKARSPLPSAAATPSLGTPYAQSGEEMLRALTAELDHSVTPASVELGPKS